MDWKTCCDKRIVKGIKEDTELLRSLIKTSENKQASEKKLALDRITAASKLSLAYDALRELLEALAIKKGFKVYNHECYTAFLKEVVKNSEKGDEFDEIQKERNAVNYYGKEITPEEAQKLIRTIDTLILFVKKILNEE